MVCALRQTTASSCSNPVLVYAHQTLGADGGKLVDVYALQFQIWRTEDLDPVLVFPNPNDDTVFSPVSTTPCPTGNRIGQGRYVARWTVPGNAPPGRYKVVWRVHG